jgi:hypothetical protein
MGNEIKKRIGTYELVACDQDMEWCILIVANFLFTPEFSQCCTVLNISPVWKGFEMGNETG